MIENSKVSRRGFLKTAALMGAALTVQPVLSKAEKVQNVLDDTIKTTNRILGTGKAAIKVSTLGFGVMGMNYHRGPHPGRKAMIRLARQAVDRGVTLFDTAETYGPFINEELAGEALAEFKNKIAITTKFGFSYSGNQVTGLDSSPKRIREMVEQSLKRLRIDTIELLYQHRFDPKTPIEDVAGTISELIKEGKVQRYGLCEVSAETIRRANAVYPVTAIQSEYHLMWREPEKEILPVCKELGIGFVPYSPINRGFLGGTVNEYTKFPSSAADNRATLPRFTPEAIRANTAIIEVLNEFGRTRGATTAQIALAWLLHKAPWIVPIPGTTKLSHLEENLRAVDFSFTNDEWKELERSISKITIVGDRYPASEQSQVAR